MLRIALFTAASCLLALGCEPFTGTGGAGGASSGSMSTASTQSTTTTSSDSSSSTGMDCTATGCPAGANATGECVKGQCVYTCAKDFADCDSNPADCEADLSLDGNCGACTVNCAKSCEPFGETYGCTEVVQIAAGGSHTCARTGTGVVWCWGDNAKGQLGIGGGVNGTPTPTKVAPLMPAGQISAAGSATCIVGQKGELACWGSDGNSTTGPLVYAKLPPIERVSVSGAGKTLVMLGSGEVRQFTLSNVTEPTAAGVTTSQAGIAAGAQHGCVFDAASKVRCFGDDSYGQLGQGSPNNSSSVPIEVGGLTAVALVAGDAHTCALDQTGLMECWGSNGFSQVSSTVASIIPSPSLIDLVSVQLMAAGRSHTAALAENKLYLWGDNTSKQCASVADLTIENPTEYAVLGGTVMSLALGGAHTCALLKGGIVKCWGDNTAGQVGVPNSAPVATPTIVNIP
ncbi:MAG: hypothetical protein U0414_01415 [Polyangiaceae bacterium]